MLRSTIEEDALRRLEYFEQLVADARKTLEEREQILVVERKTYAAKRPLTEAERDELVKHIEVGGELCCDAGFTWLGERLPKPWAEAINAWAYEHLSCFPRWFDDEERRARYMEMVRGLKLDCFPTVGE
jgi:hypothetical protein